MYFETTVNSTYISIESASTNLTDRILHRPYRMSIYVYKNKEQREI